MICPKCSNEIKDGMKFCGKCGTPVAQSAVNDDATKVFAPPTAPLQEVKPPVVQRQPVQQAATVAPQEPKKEKKQKEKKSKKKLWAILIPVIAVVVAVAILVPTVVVPWWRAQNAEPVKRRTSSLAAGYQSSVALKADGTVLATGLDKELADEVQSWTEIVALDSSGYITAGIRKDGTVVFADENKTEWDANKWTNIDKISVGENHVVGIKNDGTVVAEGTNENGECDVDSWKDIVQVEAAGDKTFAVDKNGAVLVTGDKGDAASDVAEWTDIISISASENITIGLKSDGTVEIAVNDNKYEIDVSEWKNIISVAVGKFHAIALKADGTVLTTGDSSNGKLETSAWEKIVDIAAGDEHTIGLKEDGTVVAVGNNDNEQCKVDTWTDIMIPTVEGENVNTFDNNHKDALLKKLESEISGKIHNFIYDDFDVDGTYEAFAFVGEDDKTEDGYYNGNLWFVSDSKIVELLPKNPGYGYTDLFNYVVENNGKRFICLSQVQGNYTLSEIWTVINEEPFECNISSYSGYPLEFVEEYSKDTLLGTASAFDITFDGTGHTWKPYYFYWDDSASEFREYGGVNISKTQLLQADGAKEIIDEIELNGYKIDEILYRENGIINVNTSSDANRNYAYVTLMYDESNNKITKIVEEGDGKYLKEKAKEIATYPSKLPDAFETSPSIPADAFEYNGHYYKLYDVALTWDEAKAYCENLGGHLATLTSAEEDAFIYNSVKDSSFSWWLGATDRDVEGTWKWVTGEPWSYDNSYFDNSRGEQHYLVINYDGNFWDDQSDLGDAQLCQVGGFICEWE